jgi:TetR/AcrR family transcriptional regulator, regulator of cefoperazone and chloramphenicol sensitivity
MKPATAKPTSASPRAPRPHGDATRQHILEVAGRLYAEHGAEATTSKQVCTEAQVNLAGVNYHFGSREGLYAAVLVEAHRRLLSFEALSAIADGPGDARAKLGRVIDGLTGAMGHDGWHLRVFMRELLAPSAALDTLLLVEVQPKLAILKALLAEAAGLAPQDARLPRCFLSTFAPCMMLLIANKTVLRRVMADFWQDPPALAFHLKTFAFAGLDAIAREVKN